MIPKGNPSSYRENGFELANSNLVVDTVAILAQGTPRAVAASQAFCFSHHCDVGAIHVRFSNCAYCPRVVSFPICCIIQTLTDDPDLRAPTANRSCFQAGSSTSRARSCWLRAHKPKKNMEFTTEDKLSRCYTNRSLCSCTRMTCAHRGVKVSGSGADLWIGPLYIAVA